MGDFYIKTKLVRMTRPRLTPFLLAATIFSFALLLPKVKPENLGLNSDWKISGPFGGTATTITIDPRDSQIVLAGGLNSRLFQSRDGGATWKLLRFPKWEISAISSILIDPADSNHYMAGVMGARDGRLFESKDQGDTWAAMKDIEGFGVRALAASESDHSRVVA